MSPITKASLPGPPSGTPSLIPRLLPFFNRIGERGRAKYLKSLSQGGADPE